MTVFAKTCRVFAKTHAKMHVSFRKRAIHYRALLRECKDMQGLCKDTCKDACLWNDMFLQRHMQRFISTSSHPSFVCFMSKRCMSLPQTATRARAICLYIEDMQVFAKTHAKMHFFAKTTVTRARSNSKEPYVLKRALCTCLSAHRAL